MTTAADTTIDTTNTNPVRPKRIREVEPPMSVEEIREKLERFLPIRVVLEWSPEGKVNGVIEHSFAMGTSDTMVSIFWSGKAYSMLGEHQLDGIESAKHNCNGMKNQVVIDPLAEDSPIEVDWSRWLRAQNKFDLRNAPFKLRPFGQYVVRALIAESKLAAANDRIADYQHTYELMCKERNEADDRLDAVKALLFPEMMNQDESEDD